MAVVSSPMRSHLIVGFALLAGSLTACDEGPVETDFCFNLDGNCPGSKPPPGFCWLCPPDHATVGFPLDNVDSTVVHSDGYGYWGRLVVGDTVILYKVLLPAGRWPPSTATDTARTVSWAVSDTAVARITAGTGGRGTLVARAAGTISVSADGENGIWSCKGSVCLQVRQIIVAASPATRLAPP